MSSFRPCSVQLPLVSWLFCAGASISKIHTTSCATKSQILCAGILEHVIPTCRLLVMTKNVFQSGVSFAFFACGFLNVYLGQKLSSGGLPRIISLGGGGQVPLVVLHMSPMHWGFSDGCCLCLSISTSYLCWLARTMWISQPYILLETLLMWRATSPLMRMHSRVWVSLPLAAFSIVCSNCSCSCCLCEFLVLICHLVNVCTYSQAALFFLSFLLTGEQSQFCTNVSRRPDEEVLPLHYKLWHLKTWK
jgi:hypothetical protein